MFPDLHLKQILILTKRELISAYRETSVVLYSVLLPLLLYPFLLWMMVTAMSFIEGQQEARGVLVRLESGVEEVLGERFLQTLRDDERVTLSDPTAYAPGGLFDLRIRLPNAGDADGSELVVEHFGDRMESERALGLFRELHRDYLEKQRERWLLEGGLPPEAAKPFLIGGRSISAASDVGGYLLGALLPIGLLVMVALGGAYPAIDTTAGERERGTWETLRACAPSMGVIVLSKYLFVVVVCTISGLLNLAAMLVSMRSIVAPLLRDSDNLTFDIGPLTLALLVLGVVAVAFFVAAALLLCASFARTFREGQALTTPMFMVISLPVLPLSDPNLQMTPTLALVPLVNLSLVWRQALQGVYEPIPILQTAASLAILVGVCLWLGRRLMTDEGLMNGSEAQMSWRGFLRALKSRKR